VAASTAALLTATAFGPLNAWSFVAPSDCGLGAFARVPLRPGQLISEYRGPRLPLRMQTKGCYALQIPGVTPVVVIDGASENSPFACPPVPAIYANHSARPNAVFQCMPVPRPGKDEVRKRMYLVAKEPIEAGAEIRVDYEPEKPGSYWCGAIPAETRWRSLRVIPPPPTAEEPVFELSRALEEGEATLPWAGEKGGDARLRVLVPLLTQNPSAPKASVQVNWAMISTHLPGRSGHECRERWQVLTQEAWAAANSESSGDDSDGDNAGGSSDGSEQRARR
jgi:hypothetical protein